MNRKSEKGHFSLSLERKREKYIEEARVRLAYPSSTKPMAQKQRAIEMKVMCIRSILRLKQQTHLIRLLTLFI